MSVRNWLLAGVVLSVAALTAGAESNPAQGWRTDGSSVYAALQTPAEWGTEKNVLWKTPLENWSNAIPVIVGDKILVEAEKDQLVCLSAADGKVLWKAPVGYGEADVKASWKVEAHGANGFTTPTPLCDGKQVVVFNGYGLGAGYDMAGKRLWIRLIGTPAGGWGNSMSGVMEGGIAVWGLNGNAYGIEAATGKELWKVKSNSHWGSLISTRVGDTAIAITPDGEFLRLSDGKKLAKGSVLNYNAPIVADGVAYFMCGEQGCKAFKMAAKIEDDKLALELLWSAKIGKPDRTYSSPVAFDGLVYVINQNGNLSAFDAKTGAIAWEHEMKLGGTAYPSLVITGTADGPRLLVSGESGNTAVLVPGKEFKEVGRNKLENFRTTPVCVKGPGGDRMYIRGNKNLWCFGEKK